MSMFHLLVIVAVMPTITMAPLAAGDSCESDWLSTCCENWNPTITGGFWAHCGHAYCSRGSVIMFEAIAGDDPTSAESAWGRAECGYWSTGCETTMARCISPPEIFRQTYAGGACQVSTFTSTMRVEATCRFAQTCVTGGESPQMCAASAPRGPIPPGPDYVSRVQTRVADTLASEEPAPSRQVAFMTLRYHDGIATASVCTDYACEDVEVRCREEQGVRTCRAGPEIWLDR